MAEGEDFPFRDMASRSTGNGSARRCVIKHERKPPWPVVTEPGRRKWMRFRCMSDVAPRAEGAQGFINLMVYVTGLSLPPLIRRRGAGARQRAAMVRFKRRV